MSSFYRQYNSSSAAFYRKAHTLMVSNRISFYPISSTYVFHRIETFALHTEFIWRQAEELSSIFSIYHKRIFVNGNLWWWWNLLSLNKSIFCVICRKMSLSIEGWHIIFPAKIWPTAKLNYIGHPNKSRFSKHVVMTEEEIGVRSSRNGKYIKTMALIFVLYVVAFN